MGKCPPQAPTHPHSPPPPSTTSQHPQIHPPPHRQIPRIGGMQPIPRVVRPPQGTRRIRIPKHPIYVDDPVIDPTPTNRGIHGTPHPLNRPRAPPNPAARRERGAKHPHPPRMPHPHQLPHPREQRAGIPLPTEQIVDPELDNDRTNPGPRQRIPLEAFDPLGPANRASSAFPPIPALSTARGAEPSPGSRAACGPRSRPASTSVQRRSAPGVDPTPSVIESPNTTTLPAAAPGPCTSRAVTYRQAPVTCANTPGSAARSTSPGPRTRSAAPRDAR